MEKDWTPEEEELALRFAQAVVDRGMALPAVLFLESVRPLHFVGGQFLHFLAPLSGLVVRHWDLDRLGSFFEHRGAISFVVDEIQRRDAAHRKSRNAAPTSSPAAHRAGSDASPAAPDSGTDPRTSGQ